MATLTTSYQKLGTSWIGSASGANYYVNLYAKYSRTAAQQSNNKSTVSAKVTISCDKSSSAYSVWGTWIGTYTGLFGSSYNLSATAQGGSEITLSEVSTEVRHNTDGTYTSSIGLTNADGPLDNSGATSIGAVSITLPQIPRYATSNQSLNSKTETTIKMNWSSDSTIDYIWYSTNGGTNWTAVGSVSASSGNYTISGLNANTSYSIKTRVRRKDSQLTTDSSALPVTTHQYPYVESISVSKLYIGSKQTIKINNPLGRTVSVYMKKNNTSGTTLYSGSTNKNGDFEFTPSSSTLYSSIPNNTESNAVYYCTYSSQTVSTKSGTYSIVANDCKPTFTAFTYSTNYSELTGDNNSIINGETTTTFTISTANKAVAKNSATIKKYRFECGSNYVEESYSESSNVTKSLSGCSNQTLKVTAIDSRGIETTVTYNAGKYLSYVKPSFSDINIDRKDGVESETRLSFKANYWNGNFGSGGNKINELKYRTKTTSSNTWSSWYSANVSTLTYENDVVTLNDLLIHSNGSSGGFATGTSYDVQIQITDGITSHNLTTISSNSVNVTDGLVGISMYKDYDGKYHIGINSMPDSDNALKTSGNTIVEGTGSVNVFVNNLTSNNKVGLCSADSGNHGVYSYKKNAWICYSDGTNNYFNGNASTASSASSCTGNAASASQVIVNPLAPSTGTWYNIPFSAGVHATNKYTLNGNDGLMNYSLQGTTSAAGRSILKLGNNTSTGTAGNKRGELWVYSEKNGLTELYTVASQTSDAVVYLPQHSGYLTGYKNLYNNTSGTTGNITLSETAANFDYIEVFFGSNYGVTQTLSGAAMQSVRIYSPHGKKANLFSGYPATASVFQVDSKLIYINGTSLSGYAEYYANIVNNAGSNYGSQTTVKIYRVNGYK